MDQGKETQKGSTGKSSHTSSVYVYVDLKQSPCPMKDLEERLQDVKDERPCKTRLHWSLPGVRTGWGKGRDRRWELVKEVVNCKPKIFRD